MCATGFHGISFQASPRLTASFPESTAKCQAAGHGIWGDCPGGPVDIYSDKYLLGICWDLRA